MKIPVPVKSIVALGLLLGAVLLGLWACQTNDQEAEVFSFPSLADSLAGSDSAVVVLKGPSGIVIDTLFNGRITADTKFKSLPAPHYKGGTIQIVIEGYKNGIVVYQVGKTYDGDSHKTDDSTVIIVSKVSIRIDPGELTLKEGDLLPFPHVIILPSNLADRRVQWEITGNEYLDTVPGNLRALKAGTATLRVKLVGHPGVEDGKSVLVTPKNGGRRADSLVVDPDTLAVAIGGSLGNFHATVFPKTLSQVALWLTLDSTLAEVTSEGAVKGIKAGWVKIQARALADSSARDSAWVHVMDQVAVASVAFDKHSLEIYLGGAPEILAARVLPALANPQVDFIIGNPALASIDGAKLTALQEGETFVVAKSHENPAKQDTLRLTILPPPTRPAAPVVATSDSLTNNRRPSWTWSGDKAKGSGLFRFRLDNPDLRSGATETSALGFTPAAGQELDEGLHTLYVQERDTAGNWSLSGSKGVTVDITPPTPPIVVSPISPSNDSTPSFSWTSGGGGNGIFRYKLDANAYTAGSIQTSYTTAPLASGLHQLLVQERDSAGNWSIADTGLVTLDFNVPGVPTVTGTASPTTNLTPAWTWASGGNGNGTFRYRLDNPDLSSGATTTTALTFTLPSQPAAAHVLYVQERNNAGTWSASGSKAIRVDTTKPPAPTLTMAETSPTNQQRPTFDWNKTEAGKGFFRIHMDAGSVQDTSAIQYKPGANLGEGPHTFYVQAGDSAGNWSDMASRTFTIDITPPNKPSINAASPPSPVATLKPVMLWSSGGNGGSGEYRFRFDSDAFSTYKSVTTFTPASNLTEGSHTFEVQERDASGNASASSTRSIYLVKSGVVGTRGFSLAAAQNISTAISQNGILHVAFSQAEGSRLAGRVMKFEDGVWSTVGGGSFSTTNARFPKIAFNGNDLYLAYEEYNSGEFANHDLLVKRYQEGWVSVGRVWSGYDNITAISLAIRSDGRLYVAHTLNADTVWVSDFYYNRNTWQLVGAQGAGLSSGYNPYLDLGVNSLNEVYLAYYGRDGEPENEGPCVKLYSDSWNVIGNQPMYPNYGIGINISFQGSTPLVGLTTGSGNILVRSGSSWVHAPGSPIPNLEYTDLAVSSTGSRFIAAFSKTDALTIRVQSGSNWITLGSSYNSPSFHPETQKHLAVSPSGVPYACFSDTDAGGKLTCIKAALDP